MRNLSQLILDRTERFPANRCSVIGGDLRLRGLFDLAARGGTAFADAGLRPGARVAVIGHNSESWIVTWTALQLAGVETALINPTYPTVLLAEMLSDLEPDAVVWIGTAVQPETIATALHIDATDVVRGSFTVCSSTGNDQSFVLPATAGELPGLDRRGDDVAGYMHTSGTTGTPKFCTQTHEYFLRLGRFIADSMVFTAEDTVFAPLPLFHINPLGYGVIGGLTGCSNILTAEKFSASRFWADVRGNDVTALILHAPPVEILKRSSTTNDAAGHNVRIMFFADGEFLDRFQVPIGVSAYGSTEVGGLSHLWLWRRGDHDDLPEGKSRYGGRSRHEVEWRINDDRVIEIRANRPHVLFEGYRRRGELIVPFDADGWFDTGDLGRVDESGNLVFIERKNESIRVKGEFVPIGFVEDHFAKVAGVSDVAVWHRASKLVDQEVSLYVVADHLDRSEIEAAGRGLPAFMRPTLVLRVGSIPRDDGVGKIRRRLLHEVEVLEQMELGESR